MIFQPRVRPVLLFAILHLHLCFLDAIEPVKFLEINDIHIKDEASTTYPLKVVAAMNSEKAAFVLVCGDVSTDGKEEQLTLAKEVLDNFAVPYHIVRGNHDGDGATYSKVFNQKETTYSFEDHGLFCIGLDPGFKTSWKEKYVEPDMLEVLGRTANQMPNDKPLIIFSHYPFANVPFQIKNPKDLLELFKTKKLLAVISGHYHANSEQIHDGILFTTTACASSTRKNHVPSQAKGYRVFELGSDLQLTTHFQEVPGGEVIEPSKP
jgi:predicted phosphodiesterase